MKHGALTSLLVLMFVLAGVRPAHADMLAFLHWWDSLSGPGPFNGFVGDVTLFSVGPDPAARDRTVVLFDPGGIDADAANRRVRIGVQYGFLKAEENNLSYPDRPAPGVWAIPVAATASYRFNPVVDVGASLGVIRFTGDGFGFWRTLVSPRLGIAPLAAVNRDDRRFEAFQVHLHASAILGRFDAADFGASGDFEGGNEVLWGTSFSVNVLKLKRR